MDSEPSLGRGAALEAKTEIKLLEFLFPVLLWSTNRDRVYSRVFVTTRFAIRREQMTKSEPLTVTVSEAARLSSLGRTSIFAAIRNGHIKIRKCGRRTLIEMSELRRFITNLPETVDD